MRGPVCVVRGGHLRPGVGNYPASFDLRAAHTSLLGRRHTANGRLPQGNGDPELADGTDE